ncbi:uncharacterized protein LOC105427330 [Pogonomyrmex barbatus]|uniref:Uncharacterized protein LOC105427330 n=1 Tax=Pogonomyrmex barbatus TaxID=144034 RepID=A0A6I9W9P6_9HYME|nr:uncharacterized protein LOC105427330 [Pogonomyrmex barbatus]
MMFKHGIFIWRFATIHPHRCFVAVSISTTIYRTVRIGVRRISLSIDRGWIRKHGCNFRENCLRFYITAVEEIFKRLPVSDIFLSKLQILLSHIALLSTNREISFHDLFLLLQEWRILTKTI